MKITRYLLLLILCLMTLPLGAISKNEAKSLVQSGQYSQAIDVLQQLMQQPANARDAECQKLMGQAYCMSGRYAEALPYLEKAVSQNKKSGALWYLTITRQHLYDFEGAIEALETYLPSLHSDFWLQRADSLMSECEIGRRAFDHTFDVVVIDSMMVPRQSFFEYYHLGNESGKIISSENALSFESQSGDHRIFSYGTGFAEQHCFQGQWDDVHVLDGIGSSEFKVIDPFLLSDGETLYFACDSTPGIGGLDIYRTTYDADEGRFYQPERLGMPFNSPFNDYMMAIDELHRVGWWATDRNTDNDHVMLYLFLLDDEMESLDEATIARARIDCISETWKDSCGYSALLEELFAPSVEKKSDPHVPSILITEGLVYSDASQFVSDIARESYLHSEQIFKQIGDLKAMLRANRNEYELASTSKRKSMIARIQAAEQKLQKLCEEYKKSVDNFRRIESESVMKR